MPDKGGSSADASTVVVVAAGKVEAAAVKSPAAVAAHPTSWIRCNFLPNDR